MEPGDKGILRRFGKYFRSYRILIVISLTAAVMVALSDTAIALVVKLITDLFGGITQAVSSGKPIEIQFSLYKWGFNIYDFTVSGTSQAGRMLWIIALGTLCVVLVKGAFHFLKEYLMWSVTHRIVMQLKQELFSRVVHFPLSFFDREKSGDVVSRVTYDVTQIENSIRSAVMLVKSVVYTFIFVTFMFLLEWSLTLFVLAVFPVSGILIKLFGDRIRGISRKLSLNVADYTAFLAEAIGGAKVIKAFGREKTKERSFNKKVHENYRFNMKVAKLATLHSPAQDIFSSIGMAGVVIFCGYRILYGGMTFGDLTGFLILLFNAYKPIKTLGEANNVLQRALASGRQIFDLIDQPDESMVIGSGSKKLSEVKGNIEFENVDFSYLDDIPVLQDINLIAEPGETIALVGPSGGGKSTLISLIPRFYPLHQGKIMLDGVDIAELDIDHLRRQIAIVPQETVLFSGTVEENIRFGQLDANNTEITNAAKLANAHDFIEKLSGGYQAEVGERGVQLSGGQRQRIAIARAILRDPKILLLDEATSSLDSESEHLIQDALERFRRDRTTIVIAHRLSTVQSADRIAVIVEGSLAEIGSHQELYKKDGIYRKLCDQQFGG
ncbi:MAG: ABC transporter ATP-binding protein [Candidatus Hatepunaea meridiana]|nr:ABC transporter ATP-binding protein [Candidatus Hatepunaea meridiana]